MFWAVCLLPVWRGDGRGFAEGPKGSAWPLQTRVGIGSAGLKGASVATLAHSAAESEKEQVSAALGVLVGQRVGQGE